VRSIGEVIASSSTEYNNAGWVVSSVDSYGLKTEYKYNNLGDIIETRQESIDENGNKSWIITQSEYDSLGRVIRETINGISTSYQYDKFDNIIKATFADGSSISAEYRNGLKISETNQLGQTRKFEYNDVGQLIAVILPDGSKYIYDYDKFGNQILIRDPNGNETRFTYDGFGNQLTRTLPDSSIETFEYDYLNRVIKHVSFEGVTTQFEYDDVGRVITKKFFVGDVIEIWTFKYDSQGREIEVNQNGRIIKTEYDNWGQVISVQSPEGTVAYEYNIHGQQTRVYSDKGDNVRYSYDEMGRLQTVTSNGKVTKYFYDVLGNLVKTELPNGTVTTYEYDNMNRLIKLTNFVDVNQNGIKDVGELISEFDYKLNKQGQKIQAKETFNIGGVEKQNVIDWNYDLNNRLIREVFNHYDDLFDQTQEWEYDLVGNRTLQKLDKGNDNIWDEIISYNYDINDRIIDEIVDDLTSANRDRTIKYGYDHTQQTGKTITENGELVSTTTFEYDLQGRMSVVTITTNKRTENTRY
jgi:YD repeat-containing protein